ncbi:glycosyl hydrolase family protein [Maribacter algarum]|uniref:Glycosyl hydrolase family protein n=1 Tax=Maribacter algarum (ex Zhang et al. 2020) TaxID=2578118 RepID=A0A5S3PH28_9FLAO|nr:family 16 glycosylhydrolase [Maribacter algarum]TMM53416.1 glycosyl hydrolase family protein [Maribacter algarum]
MKNLVVLVLIFIISGCVAQQSKNVFPASDPNNEGGWILNEEVSDEFEGKELDRNKWFIEGENGDYYIWKGRPPSQFVPHNVIVENGKLKLRTKWEPDYKFANENYADGGNNDAYGIFEGKPLPVTTAGVITKKRFLNGYMEVKSKAGNAAITAAFWGIGYEQELDIFEQMGNPKVKDGDITDTGSKSTIHDWSPPAERPTWAYTTKNNKLPFRVADDFHVYGAEWGEDYLKLYRDGKLIDEVTQDELGTDWVLNNPMEIWLDSEIFKWLGLPDKKELPVDFEIEYLRVWQKPNDNLLARQFFDFEGPILFEKNPRPLKMVPESSVPNDYQKFWEIDSLSSKYFRINEGDYYSGVNSLEFSGFGKNEKLETEKVVALSPKSAVNIPEGEYNLSLKVWLAQGRAVRKLYLSFENPKQEIPIDLTGLERRKWISIDKKISKTAASKIDDQFKIEVRKEDVPEIKAAKFYLDDIVITPINK